MSDEYDPYDRTLDIPDGRNCARVMGVKRNFFVEFEFVAGDPTLTVELVLPIAAFSEFCTVNDVLMLDATSEEAHKDYEVLCREHGIVPGRPDELLAR
jgi:phenol hydroxylase P0 protein